MHKTKRLGVALALALALGMAAGAAQAGDGEALAQKYGCLGCHAMDQQVVGPSYKAIAAKFKGQSGASAKLVGALQSGEGHPKVEASKEDLTTIMDWILSL
jgi:cytochrome c